MSGAQEAADARELTPCWPPFQYEVGNPCNCPGCGRSSWRVGRTSAECAGCALALPLYEGSSILYGAVQRIDGSRGLRDEIVRHRRRSGG